MLQIKLLSAVDLYDKHYRVLSYSFFNLSLRVLFAK